jgi:oligogalacturonide transport system substrate-binding protein
MGKELGASNFTKDKLAAAKVDGKQLGMPVSTIYRQLFVNKSALAKYGVAEPKTWEDLFAARSKLPNDVFPFYSYYQPKSVTSLLLLQIMAEQTGKPVGNADNKLLYTKKDFTKAVKYYKSLVDKKITPSKKEIDNSGIVEGAPFPGIVNQKWLSLFSWNTDINVFATQFEDMGATLDIVPALTMKNGKSTGELSKPSAFYSIPKSSKHQQAAAKLINFMLNDPTAAKLQKVENGVPDSKVARNTLEKAGLITPLMKKSLKIAEGTVDTKMANVYRWDQPTTMEAASDAFTQLDYGKTDVDGAATLLYNAFKEQESEFK